MPSVLIVDDDKHMRSLLERMLRRAPLLRAYDLKLLQAADGEQGLEVVDREKPDVVVCDLLMPRLDGWAFCKALRARPHGKDVGLIVVSGLHRERGVSQQIREEFGGTFFAKPHQLPDVIGAVEKIMAARAPHTAPTRPAAMPLPSRAVVLAMEGTLAQKNLARLLLDLYEGSATGILELRRGRVEKRIELLDGHPVGIVSNQRSETLGHFLVDRKAITPAQHQQALARAVGSGARLGEVLVEMGALTAARMVGFLQLQARHKIAHALRWKDGSFAYEPSRELLDRAKTQAIDGPAVVFWGLRESAIVEDVAAACDALDGRKVTLTARGEKLLGAFGRAFGDALAQAIAAGGASVEELLARHHEVARVLTAVDALILTGCGEASAPVPAGPVPPKKRPTVDPLALDVLSDVARTIPPRPMPPSPSEDLYDVLFGDEPRATAPPPPPLLVVADDGIPMADLAVDDSAVIDLTEEYDELQDVRDELLLEYLRVQGMDWYAVLQVPRDADTAAIDKAFSARTRQFALEQYAAVDLGRDYAKLEELHLAYRRAREVLSDPAERRAYERQLGVGSVARNRQAIDAELCFHRGEELVAKDELDEAIRSYRMAVQGRPDAADYHAAVGWALHLRSRRDQRRSHAAELDGTTPENDGIAAAAHLQQALSIDPDHAAALAFTGRVLAEAGDDPERALRHLERALDAQPPRFDALGALEKLRTERGEMRELERVYRKLIHRVGSDRDEALRLWLALAVLYRSHIGDRDGARVAYQCAARLAPHDPAIVRALDELTADEPGRFGDRAEALRGRFRLDQGSPEPVLEMIRAAAKAEQLDTAWVAAGVLVARDLADGEATTLYRRHRPKAEARARGPVDESIWPRLRHPEDDPDIGALFALLEPLAAELSPLGLSTLGVGEHQLVPSGKVPEALAAVRRYAAEMLEVREPEIYAHKDFAEQVHIGALHPPILLVGPQALEQTDRVELSFWVGRAMTYVRPGRAVGGSRPGRVLKALLSAALSFSVPGMTMPDPDGLVARGREYLAGSPEEYRELVRDVVSRVTYGRTNLNLSTWARALGRTADRVGLVLCGDPAVAGRSAASLVTGEALGDLLDYSLSADHLAVRRSLGLSVDV
jgi:CheY-like chemotaxis protein/tetratricopeptide (TPR) repeat protein